MVDRGHHTIKPCAARGREVLHCLLQGRTRSFLPSQAMLRNRSPFLPSTLPALPFLFLCVYSLGHCATLCKLRSIKRVVSKPTMSPFPCITDSNTSLRDTRCRRALTALTTNCEKTHKNCRILHISTFSGELHEAAG